MKTQTIQANDDRVLEYATQAKDAGVPRDQFENFITGGYLALEGYLPFHSACRDADLQAGPSIIALGGKRGPGKSHATMAQVGLDDCQRYPGIKVLFLRKIQRSASESLEDLVIKVFWHTPHTFGNNRVQFPNGSRILIGGYKDEKDIEKYLGIEYDIIVIEEVTQISETRFDKMLGSRRSSKVGWRPRVYLSTNADGIGLAWFKQRLVYPFRDKREHETGTRFFDVTHIHNPFIDDSYHEWLDSLTGALRKAWRDGDWDAFAGMAFPMWSRDAHVIDPFDIPSHWPKWRGLDWGSTAPFACLWLTKDPDTKRIYVYRELYKAGLTTLEQTDWINEMSPPEEEILFTYADPALWAKQNVKGEYFSAEQEYREHGIILTKGENDRINGKRKVDQILSPMADTLPGVQIFNTCPNLISQLSNLPLDERRIEDVDTDAEDHAYDAFRYALTNQKRVQVKKPKPITNRARNVSVL